MEPSAPPLQGKLKIVLGYAAGVGKTFRMLDEGQQLKASGRDVVIGYFEPHGRADTIAKTEGLAVVPRRVAEYRGRQFDEMDVNAILARRPEICLVDEFPHTNVPGSLHTKRWEDVLVLLEAGIDVITTMNIQHLESLNDQIREITGVQVRETLPDWVLQRAEELILVDLTPGALLNRLDRGVVYAPDKARRAKENFFKESTLTALREMALRQAAHEVEVNQQKGTPFLRLPETSVETASTDFGRERILIYVTPAPSAAALIRRGRRVADYLRADCVVVAIHSDFGIARLSSLEKEALERHLAFAQKLQIETRIITSANKDSAAELLADFARRNAVTQVANILRHAGDIQVTVVASRL
jgi:two-component system, OmpR family, sensor histidine kinase KdpD